MNTPDAQAKRSQPKQSKAKPKAVPPRSEHVPLEIRHTVEQLRDRFRQKFGRDPGPNDPILFDPDFDSPVPLRPEAVNRLWEGVADTLLNLGEISPEKRIRNEKDRPACDEGKRTLLDGGSAENLAGCTP